MLVLLAALISACATACRPAGSAPAVAETGPPSVAASPAATTAAAAGTATAATPAGAAVARDGLPRVSADRLPPEARDTLALIERGGPHPYRQDGVEFQNRERLLPSRPRGYYREYTVRTPGARDRGARRIVTGREGEIYYSDDHYASFVRVATP